MEFEDRVTIATPEGVDLELTLAGLGSRFAAALIDGFLQTMLVVALGVVLLGLDGFGAVEDTGGLGAAVFFVASFLVWFGYDILFEVLASGRTPGKRWNGLRVVRSGGHPITFLPSAVRNILRLVDLLPAAYVVGCISVLVTARNQRLGDLAAGTLVIRDRRDRAADAPPLPPRFVRPTPEPEALAAWDVSAVTGDELIAVRAFLDRRLDLEAAARHHLAWQLADALRPKVAGAPRDIEAERFLEHVAAAKAART